MFYAYAGVGEHCGAFVHDRGRVRMYARMHAYSRSHACVCVCRHTRRVMVRTPIVLPMRLRWTGIGAESSPILSIEMYTARSKTPFATYTKPALVLRIVRGTSGTNGRDYCDALRELPCAYQHSPKPVARPWVSHGKAACKESARCCFFSCRCCLASAARKSFPRTRRSCRCGTFTIARSRCCLTHHTTACGRKRRRQEKRRGNIHGAK